MNRDEKKLLHLYKLGFMFSLDEEVTIWTFDNELPPFFTAVMVTLYVLNSCMPSSVSDVAELSSTSAPLWMMAGHGPT